MRKISISLYGCHDSTTFDMELTEEQIEFLILIAKKSKEASTDKCMPTMDIDE